MKKIYYIIICISIILFVGNGVLAQNITDNQGKKQGHWVKVAKNGKKTMEGNYKDDYPVDTFYYYDSKGNVTIKNYFTNKGKDAHTWLLFPNGKVQAEGNYIDKQKQGTWKYFNEKGKRITEVEYKDNKKHGKEKLYDDDGKEVLQVISYVAGVRNGQFYKSLQTYGYYTATYKDDVLQGEYKEYFPTKQVRIKGDYVQGKKEGLWSVYHSDGRIAQEFTYKNDELVEDVIVFSTPKGELRVKQTEIAMITSSKNKIKFFDMQGNSSLANDNFEEMLQYFNGDRFMRLNEKSNIYMNVIAIKGINADGSVKTDINFGSKIIPDENGKQIINSLTRED